MKFSLKSLLGALVALVLFAFLLSAVWSRFSPEHAALLLIGVSALGMAPTVSPKLGVGSSVFGRNLADNDLQDAAVALPNGAATTYSTAFKIGPGVHPDGIEIEVTVPDATTAEAPDAKTLTVDIVAGDTATPTTGASLQKVFTGAGGAGFTGATFRMKVPSTAGDYVRLRTVGSGAGNMSGKSATIRILQ